MFELFWDMIIWYHLFEFVLSVTGFIEISVEPVSKNHLVLFTLFVSVIYRLFSITNFFINQSFLFMNNHTQFHIIKTNMSHSKIN